jgi:hypothetical protein
LNNFKKTKTMKKFFLITSMLLIFLAGRAQNTAYVAAMRDALKQLKDCKSIEAYQSVANTFNMIGNTTKSEWLPLYYHAQSYIIMSFMVPSDPKLKDTYLDAAEASITKMMEITPAESEVFALQALLYSGRLMVNPMERGQKYSALSEQAVSKALKSDPGNPRAQYIKLRSDMGKAQFFGKDPKEYCPSASALLANWDQYKVRSPLHPDWGKSELAEIVASCK